MIPKTGREGKHIQSEQKFSSVQLLSRVQLFAIPWTAARQVSLSITNSRTLLKLMFIELVIPSNISSSVVPFSSHLQSFPASGSFPMSQFLSKELGRRSCEEHPDDPSKKTLRRKKYL